MTGTGIAILIWCFNILILSRESLNWSQTNGHVLSSSLTIDHLPKFLYHGDDPSRWYGTQVQYEYSVGDDTYMSNRLSFQRWGVRNPKEPLKEMNKYRRHHQVKVYYDPNDPKEAVLERGGIEDVFIPLMIGGVLTFWGLVAYWGKSLEIKGKGPDSFLIQGHIYQNQGKFEAALLEYNQAVKINPYSALGYNSRGNLYLEHKYWDHAIADLKQAIACDPRDAFVYFSLANAYLGKEQYDHAWAYMQKAMSMGYKVDPPIVEDIKKKLTK